VDKSIIIPYSLRKLLVCSGNYSIVADFQSSISPFMAATWFTNHSPC